MPRILSLLLLLLLSGAALFWGSVSLPASEVWHALCGAAPSGDTASYIVMQSRLPQLLTAILAGGALGVGGLAMQTTFSNPLADPSLLGVNAGASLGAAVAMLWLGGSLSAPGLSLGGHALTVLAAFAGAAGVILLLILCASALRGTLHLLVAGVMISFIVSSFVSILNYFATAQGVQSYVVWGLGDFSGVGMDALPAFAALLAAGVLPVVAQTKALNALLLGEDYARNLGVRIRTTRNVLLLSTGLLSAVVTAACGPIAFVGLAAPHVARLTTHSADHRRLLPATLLWGANLALLALLVARMPADGGLLPVNAVTPLFGVPVVLFLLFRRRQTP